MTDDLIKNYTLNRNMLGSSVERSAERIADYIELVAEGLNSSQYKGLLKSQTNDISAIATNTGLFSAKAGGGYEPTQLNKNYRVLQAENKRDAWQWLLTRTLWHQEVPNQTASRYNNSARQAGVRFNLFRSILGLLQMLAALPGDERFLYFSELTSLFSDDRRWGNQPNELFNELLKIRAIGTVSRNRALLEDLEDEVGAPRDNLNTVFVKAYRQTGLFIYKRAEQGVVGFALSSDLSPPLQRRLRHVLDSSPPGNPEVNWAGFVEVHENDLPLEVEAVETRHLDTAAESATTKEIGHLKELIPQLKSSLDASGLQYNSDLLTRFVASLLTKPFVILTGLSGSGKTKIAEALAVWLEAAGPESDPFVTGAEIRASSAVYRVVETDRLSVVFATDLGDGRDKLTTIPRGLIADWVDVIHQNDLSRDTSAQEIRDLVAKSTSHDLHLNGFASQLKAAAFAFLETNTVLDGAPAYRVLAVGADWTSGEHILGYPDALSAGTYVRKPALDVLLGARERLHVPHFLVLDEMNLSHVERYFAEILSAIETRGRIDLYSAASGARSSVPPFIEALPPNLSVIGTVNVDETTYMFSPKVLDRANVVEFRVSLNEMSQFLNDFRRPDLNLLRGQGLAFAPYFAGNRVAEPLSQRQSKIVNSELSLFFEVLAEIGAEFGFRVGIEISTFISNYLALTDDSDASLVAAIDAQILQKLLPKLHGAEREIRPILWALAGLTRQPRDFLETGQHSPTTGEALRTEAKAGLRLSGADPATSPSDSPWYPLSYTKIVRMLRRLNRLGYVAYAEG